MKNSRYYTAAALIVAAILLAAPAQAGVLTVTFTNAALSGSPGDTLTYGGSIANTTDSTLFINAADISLISFGPGDYDYTPFLLNAPFWLDPYAGSDPFDFFTVTIPSGFAGGSYFGSFLVQGGGSDSDDTLIGTGDFEVDVTGSEAATPEPTTLMATGLALAAIGVTRRRRRARAS